MVGVSLPSAWLADGSKLPLKREALLPELYRKGVRSVEIRNARLENDPEQIRSCADLLWNYGFQVTIHCRATALATAIEEVFTPIRLVLQNLRQDRLTIVIHPIPDDNVQLLRLLADYAEENQYPVMIALENNRLLPDGTEGDSTALVLDAVQKANRPNVGICFDLGHYTYFVKKNHPDTPDMVPDKEFFKRMVHTHIHGVNGLKTHFPLGLYELDLDRLLGVLPNQYLGVYNIELDFPRFQGLVEPEDALMRSVETLQAHMPFNAKIFDEVRETYDRDFLHAIGVLQGSQPGTRLGLLHSTSYLFNTGGFPWAMDLAFRCFRDLSNAPSHLSELLHPLKLMILTHEHSDHFDSTTIRELAKNPKLQWIVPDFLLERTLALGVREEMVLVSKPGKTIQVGPLTILPFEGRHLRPVSKAGVPCYGYHISAEGSPSMAFPGDVRDYSLDNLPPCPKADYCFAHVWMGDGNCLSDDFTHRDSNWASFMLQFSQKNIIITHLYEIGRPERYMWQHRHGLLVEQRIHEQSPETKTFIPKRGEILRIL